MPEDHIRCTRETQRVALDGDALARCRLTGHGHIAVTHREARINRDDSTHIEHDNPGTSRDCQRVAQRSWLFAILQAGDFDDFTTATTTGKATISCYDVSY